MYKQWKIRFLALAMLAGLLTSYFGASELLREYTDHDCTGVHCSVCRMLELAGQVLHHAGWASPVVVFLLFFTRQQQREQSAQTTGGQYYPGVPESEVDRLRKQR